jgi:hypothetical protein
MSEEYVDPPNLVSLVFSLILRDIPLDMLTSWADLRLTACRGYELLPHSSIHSLPQRRLDGSRFVTESLSWRQERGNLGWHC